MLTIYTVDAFTNKPFAGNPAGVVLVNEFLDDSIMQNISTELGYSNTAFVKRLGKNHYHIRWFTTVSEAPLCGHATVGTMHVLSSLGEIKENEEIKFESLSGSLYARQEGSWYYLNFPAYVVEEVQFSTKLARVVNFKPKFVGFVQNTYFMEFEDESSLKSLSPDLNLLKTIDCRALIATAKGTEYDFHSRYFAPSVGIDEDPVCASAHCRLIPYWAAKLQKSEVTAFQSSKRGGVLKCKNLGNRVEIAGEAVTVFKSEFDLGSFEKSSLSNSAY